MDIGHAETEQLLSGLEDILRQEYSQAAREATEKMEDYFRRFEAKDRIKRAQLANGEITADYYNYWRTGQIMIGKRWQEQVNAIATDLTRVNEKAASIIYGYEADAYALNHNYATFEVERGALVDTSYTMYDRMTVERLLRDGAITLPEPRLLPYPREGGDSWERFINEDTRWNRQKITSAVMQGIVQGESINAIAKRMRGVAQMNLNQSVRTARTCMTGAQNAGRVDSYLRAINMGIDMEQEWLATLDGRTRHSHRQLDGEHVPVGKKFSNGCRYPGDPYGPPGEIYNCRCTLIARLKGFEDDSSDLRLRNTDHLGKMTYEEWKDEHDIKGQAQPHSGSRQRRERRERIAEIGEAAPKPIENPDVVQGLKPIPGKHSRADDCRAVNPNYHSAGTPEWKNNCQRCVTTYEARRRGYDVTALPCYYPETDRFAIGTGHTLPYESNGRYDDKLWHAAGLSFSQLRGFTKEQATATVEKLMKEYGNGSRAIISGFWEDSGMGHVFIAENIQGEVHFIDPQNGDMNCGWYMGAMNPKATSIFRIDDLPFNSNIWDVFRNDVL